ncbi:hypothetical protein CJF23_21050 [Aeromonas veronii]|nr:hypothetical protein CGZ72_20890 [Aeromonas veronii]TYD40214.1 hypothetical protein CJF23_21050 [Aeromonas veronii]
MSSAQVNKGKITIVLYIFNSDPFVCCSTTTLSDQFLGSCNISFIVKNGQIGIDHFFHQNVSLMICEPKETG